MRGAATTTVRSVPGLTRLPRPGRLILILLAGPALACAIGTLVLMIVATDSDRYGRVAVPGAEVLVLDPGTVHVFYSEDTTLGADATLHEPDLDLAVAPAAGGSALAVEDPPSTIQLEGLGKGAAVAIGEVEIENGGRYRVSASGEESGERRDPEVTLGTNPGGELASKAWDLLLSPWALAYLAAVFLVAWLVARARRA